jgi:hypothetical protein
MNASLLLKIKFERVRGLALLRGTKNPPEETLRRIVGVG